MAGHSPEADRRRPCVERMGEQGGITTMLPTADAEWVGAELTRRFGLPLWSFTLTATDANRWAIRLARLVTGRPKILVFAYCYHGSVDETFAVPGPDGEAVARPGNVGAAGRRSTMTTRVAEFNDLAGVERQLAHGDVAAILTEPALTNIGIVLPEPGFMDGPARAGHALRRAADHRRDAHVLGRPGRRHPRVGAASRTSSSSARASAAASRAAPTASPSELADAHRARDPEADLVDVGGVGGTLAGNALSVAAMRATLEHVLTDEAFAGMIDLATPFTARRAGRASTRTDVPWSVSQLGARAEYRFASPGAAQRHRVRRGRDRRRARRVPAPVPGQPRRPDDAVPQHGADVPRHRAGRRRPAHPAVRRTPSPSWSATPPRSRPEACCRLPST